MAGGIGAGDLRDRRDVPLHAFLFGEDQGRYVLRRATPTRRRTSCTRPARSAIPAMMLGLTGGDSLILPGDEAISVAELRAAHEAWLPDYMAGKAALEESDAMPMDAREIESLIKAALPDAKVEIKDLAGDGDHYAATVVSAAFKGKRRVQQHQMVYAALQGPHGRRAARPCADDRRTRQLGASPAP